MRAAGRPLSSLLESTTHADVCVIGAGIAGLSVAYQLCRAGRSVIVLEAHEIGSGETGRTTAHLVNALDERYCEIARLHGEHGARLAASSHTRAIEEIESIVNRERIDCEFERLPGYLFAPAGDDPGILNRELEAAHQAGLVEVELIPRAPLVGFETGPCLRFPNQGQFHPFKYLSGLATAIQGMGGIIHTNTHVTRIGGGAHARVETSGGPVVPAKFVVVATNTPANDLITIHTKQAAYRSYVIGAHIPKGSVTRALYWDTLDPFHYVRVQAETDAHDVLIVGGEDHRTGQADETGERFSSLAAWALERFPMIDYVPYRWSGQVMQSIDGLAFIGRNPGDEPNVLIVTGDSGNGMTHGTIAGLLLTDLILGKTNPWTSLYDPARISLRSAGRFLALTANTAAQYADLITPGEIDSTDQIHPDAGAILRRGLSKVAVYRDKKGCLNEFSAVCPHLGCVVNWNITEKTWDCPCHGSRFEAMGGVISGPAESGLKSAQ